MRRILGLLAVAASGSGLAQTPLQAGPFAVSLDKPVSIAGNVSGVRWSVKGEALIYDAKDADGAFQGAFRTDTGLSKTLYRLPVGWEVKNFAFLRRSPIALELIALKDEVQKQLRWKLVALNADTLKAEELGKWEFGLDEKVGSDILVSPSLDHALVTLKAGEKSRTFVVINGANKLTVSNDIDLAQSKGSRFAGWSADGTAYFSAGASAGEQTLDLGQFVSIDTGHGQVLTTNGDGNAISFTVELSPTKNDGVMEFVFRGSGLNLFNATAPPVGTEVLEVMPWNGGLRSIRSKGPFKNVEIERLPVVARKDQATVTSGIRQSRSGAAWIVEEGKSGNEIGAKGLLLCAECEQWWFNPSRTWVAYESFRGLYVRQVQFERR